MVRNTSNVDITIPVLDHGFVRLIDYMGDDSRIVQAARVSYGEGTKTVREDKALIDYLVRNHHTSPLEQVVFTFHIKLPIFVARQWVRHRTARLNEVSARYSEMQEEFYIPDDNRVQRQDSRNKQSSGELLEEKDRDKALTIIEESSEFSYDCYRQLLQIGVSRELARIVLPLNIYTEWYWQMDLNNLFHFIKLRGGGHAQWEIREYTKVIGGIVREIVPYAYESFERHILKEAIISGTAAPTRK
jgi:thymidylate synthase (FAD)